MERLHVIVHPQQLMVATMTRRERIREMPASFSMRRGISVVLALLVAPSLATAESNGITLGEVVQNVEANEALYRNIELKYRMKYRRGYIHDVDEYIVDEIDEATRIVLQDGWIYFKQRRDNGFSKFRILLGYAGKETRVVQKAVANIHRGRFFDSRILGPHMFLLAEWAMPSRLFSKILRNEHVAGSDNAAWKWKCLGTETIDGLNCVKLQHEAGTQPSGKVYVRCYYWLAIERNYIPVKILTFNPWISEKQPVGVQQVKEMREIAPGIWFPFHCVVKLYDAAGLFNTGKVGKPSQYDLFTEKATLDPRYDISLFRDIPIPDGTAVYELSDGKIVKSYVQGGIAEPKPPSEEQPGNSLLLYGMIVVALLAVGCGVWIYRSSRRRRQAGQLEEPLDPVSSQ